MLFSQVLSQAFSRTLGESLPHILATMQSHSTNTCSSVSRNTSAGNMLSSSNSSGSFAISSPPSSAGLSSGNFVVPSFISTYCTLGNSSLTSPSLFGSRMSRTERFPPSTSLLHRRSISVLFYHFAGIPSSLNKPFVVGPGYSPIPGKLVTKIRSGQFVDIADRLGENLKALEAELQTYLDGNFWRVHQKNEYKRSPTLSHGWRHSRSTCGFSAAHILLDGRT